MKHVLLHACCAPCSPYVLQKLGEKYRLTVFFYNPNIHGEDEYGLRLEETFRIADRIGADLVATTLSVSPHKNAAQINRAGRHAEADGEGVLFFEADFKKQDGYRKTCGLAKEYDFYRQDFCGCSFSRRESEERKNAHRTDTR